MFEQVSVRHPDLLTHATTVAGIGDQVTTAAEAGSEVRPGVDAYGKLCVMVPAMLASLQDVLVSGIASAAGSLQDTAVRLRTTAQSYEEIDRLRASVFDSIRAGS
ncbi:type VII secretion target [Actinoplanes sp. CA-030573]|uniref:type VII secretion target n=1 Tax=Actinoplanes sp. CA-030573 TaxID=3239898 RepID=UPI003D917FD7